MTREEGCISFIVRLSSPDPPNTSMNMELGENFFISRAKGFKNILFCPWKGSGALV